MFCILITVVSVSLFGRGTSGLRSQSCVYHLTQRRGLSDELHYKYEKDLRDPSLLTSYVDHSGQILKFGERAENLPNCGLLPLSEGATNGSWYQLEDGHLVYELENCNLRRLTADSARSCLAGKYIAFVGDSLLRYQYLQLAYFLSHKRQGPRYNGTKTLARELDWPHGFVDFFANGSRMLVEDAVDANVTEDCDCLRVEHEKSREYRRLCITPKGSGSSCQTADGGVAPSDILMRFHQSFTFPNWIQAPKDGVAAVFKYGPIPDLIILNHGFWIPVLNGPIPDEELKAGFEEIFRNVTQTVALLSGGHTRLVWKTTTSSSTHESYSYKLAQVGTEAAIAAGIPVLDLLLPGERGLQQGLRGSLLHWDKRRHFWGYAYQEFNDILFNSLCDSNCGWVP